MEDPTARLTGVTKTDCATDNSIQTLENVLTNLFSDRMQTKRRAFPFFSEQKSHGGCDPTTNYAYQELQIPAMIKAIGEITGFETVVLEMLIAYCSDEQTLDAITTAIREVNFENPQLGEALLTISDNYSVPEFVLKRSGFDGREYDDINIASLKSILTGEQSYNDRENYERSLVEKLKTFYEKSRDAAKQLKIAKSPLLQAIATQIELCLADPRLEEFYRQISTLEEKQVLDLTHKEFIVQETERNIEIEDQRRQRTTVKVPGYAVVLHAKDRNGKDVEVEIGFFDGRTNEDILKEKERCGSWNRSERTPMISTFRRIPTENAPDYHDIVAQLLAGAPNPNYKVSSYDPRRIRTGAAVQSEFKQCKKTVNETRLTLGVLAHLLSSVAYRKKLTEYNLEVCIAEENSALPTGREAAEGVAKRPLIKSPITMYSAVPPVLAAQQIRDEKRARAVANDYVLGDDYGVGYGQRVALLAGANGAGKTTYLINLGQNYLLANIGWLHCAQSVTYSPGGRIYTLFADRPQSIEGGKSRHISQGHDIRYILERATAKDIIILDEFFTGTEESASIELGKRVIDYIKQRVGATAYIATHIHPLQRHYEQDPTIRNLRALIDEFADGTIKPTFRISDGIAGLSYGVRTVDHILDMDEITRVRLEKRE